MDTLLHARIPTGPDPRPVGSGVESIFPIRRLRTTAVIVGVIVIYQVARVSPSLAAAHALVAWLAALVFAATFILGTFRPFSIAVLLGGLAGAAMQLAIPSGSGFIITIVAITQATRLTLLPSRLVAGITGVAYLAALIVTAHHFQFGALVAPVSGLGFAYIAASSFQRLRHERRSLWDEKQKTEALLQEVLAGRDARIRAAALDERAHLAREIHDILAHTLSALSVQLEGVHLLMEQQPADPAALAAVERASRLAREGLDETRRAVGTLRGDALPGPELLSQLVTDFEHDSHIPCHLSIEGQPVSLAPEARLALYRTAQEALTNIRKHADASTVDVHLRYGDDGANLTVENIGIPRPSPVPGGGYGLNGLRERAELVRGTLAAGPTAAGFKVHLWLPA